jgi:acetyl esterase/lipase
MTTRRTLLQTGAVASLSFLDLPSLFAAEGVPQSVLELWADFDPRKDPLEVEVIREWKEDGAVFRHVRYFIGTFKGKPARMAAVYGFPEGAKEKLPAVMHIHGGGQRGSESEVTRRTRSRSSTAKPASDAI